MNLQPVKIALLSACFLAGTAAGFAQQHDHATMGAAPAATAKDSKPIEIKDEIEIFCPTMKTGQLCSSGTANILQLKGDEAKAWVVLARKYNRSVDAATLQLFKDAEGVLSPKQLALLKQWFAVGLNPQINELLFTKGLGPQKESLKAPAATAGDTSK